MEMAHGISVNTESKLVKFVSRVKYANYAIKYLPFRNPLDGFLCLLDEFHVNWYISSNYLHIIKIPDKFCILQYFQWKIHFQIELCLYLIVQLL